MVVLHRESRGRREERRLRRRRQVEVETVAEQLKVVGAAADRGPLRRVRLGKLSFMLCRQSDDLPCCANLLW